METLIREKCGTYAGYRHHINHGEKPCGDCLTASSQHSRDFRLKYPEKEKERKKKWSSKNSEKIAEMSRRRRARIKNNDFEFYTEDEVLNLYGKQCYICNKDIDLLMPRRVGTIGWENGLHIDHIVPISKGGSDTLNNVRPAHALCNIKKGDKING
jgi:5-methylcytosine-specific restriction endonuclease McrA